MRLQPVKRGCPLQTASSVTPVWTAKFLPEPSPGTISAATTPAAFAGLPVPAAPEASARMSMATSQTNTMIPTVAMIRSSRSSRRSPPPLSVRCRDSSPRHPLGGPSVGIRGRVGLHASAQRLLQAFFLRFCIKRSEPLACLSARFSLIVFPCFLPFLTMETLLGILPLLQREEL